jgi:hypothetical protein
MRDESSLAEHARLDLTGLDLGDLDRSDRTRLTDALQATLSTAQAEQGALAGFSSSI